MKVSIQDLKNLFISQNGLCNLSSIPLYISEYPKDERCITASLDRIDNKKGYLIDNIQRVHKTVNLMKVDYNQKYFIDLCKIIDNYQKSKSVAYLDRK